MTVASILARAAIQLQDSTHIRWPTTELLDWLNDGQREIVLKKPNASTHNTSMALLAGARQTLPASAVLLLDVVRNLPGSAIRLVSREILDSQIPNWYSQMPQTQVMHYCYRELDPQTFYVYPPNNGTGVVELVYSAAPADAQLDGIISLDDIYGSALLDYLLYRAYSKDAEFAANDSRAISHYQAFQNALGGRAQAELVTSPNTSAYGNPNVLQRTP